MRNVTLCFLLIVTAFSLVGCVEHTRVGGGYVLVRTSPPVWMADASPSTSLYYQGKRVWPIVYSGCFWPEPAGKFYHDGVIVFVAPVLGSDGYNEPLVYPQLYAMRGKEPAVIISQRIFDQPLTNRYEVERVAAIPNGVRVRFEFSSNEGRQVYSTNDVSWGDIVTWAHEAENSAPVHTTPSGTYRILPRKRPNNTVQRL